MSCDKVNQTLCAGAALGRHHVTTPPYMTLHYTTRHCTTLHCTALHCTALHHTTQHCNTQHYTQESTEHLLRKKRGCPCFLVGGKKCEVYLRARRRQTVLRSLVASSDSVVEPLGGWVDPKKLVFSNVVGWPPLYSGPGIGEQKPCKKNPLQ